MYDDHPRYNLELAFRGNVADGNDQITYFFHAPSAVHAVYDWISR